MNWQPTKEQLELAALACGVSGGIMEDDVTWWFTTDDDQHWQPHLPTTQGKADLLDMMLAAGIAHRQEDGYLICYASGKGNYADAIITNGNKHAALAKSAITVAAMVGEKMKGGV